MPIRDDVLNQLLAFLKNKNNQKSGLSDFLKHPFVLMIIGTVAVAIFTQLWSARNQKNQLELEFRKAIIEKQLQLLNEFPTIYHKTGSQFNTYHQFLIKYAKELLVPVETRNIEKLEVIRNEGMESEKKYRELEPIGPKLAQIKAIYKSNDVINSTKLMDDKWSSFVDNVHEINRAFNSREYTIEDVKRWADFREKTIDEINLISIELSERMTKEIIDAYEIISQ